MQKFSPILLIFAAVLFGPAATSQAQETDKPAPSQPIAFNHKLHTETAKMACVDCHEPRGDGSAVAMPQPPKCMKCHNTVATDKPDIQRLAEAAKNEDPIPWVRVYRVPSFVTFSHKTHSTTTCEECHGPVAERVAIAPEKEMHMANCIGCHATKGAKTTCDTCHGIMSKNGHSPFDVDSTVLARLHIPAATPAAANPIWHSSAPGMPQVATIASFLHAPLL